MILNHIKGSTVVVNDRSQLNLLVHDIANTCLQKSLKLTTAESCTGGGVSYELTSIPGSSQWFDCAFVTYSNNAKIAMLGVSSESIELHGAVSQEVAKEMAEGALRHSCANVSLAITGIAGPDGGTPEKPVGTIWFSWSGSQFSTQCQKKIFMGDREAVRFQAIMFSLKKLLELIRAHY
jgi:nicotinamide-nucleotide amidase